MKSQHDVREIAERYLAAANAHDIDAMVALWEPGGVENFPTFHASFRLPDEFRRHFESLFEAFPDVKWQTMSITTEAGSSVVRSKMHGTHLGPYQGLVATGRPFAVDTIDFLEIRDGKIVHNDVLFDGLAVLRQIGALPPANSKRERVMQSAFNALTPLRRRVMRRRR